MTLNASKTQIDEAIIILFTFSILSKYVPIAVDLGLLTLTTQRGILLSITLLAAWNIHKGRKILLTSPLVGWILLFSLLFASVAWSIAPVTSLRKIDDIFLFSCATVGLLLLPTNKKTFRQLTSALLAVCVCLTALGLSWAALGNIGSPLIFGLANRNEYARHLVALLPIAYAAAYSFSGRKRVGWAVIAVILTVLLPLAGSRSGFVAGMLVITLLLIAFLKGIADISLPGIILALSLLIPILLIGAGTAIQFGLLPDRLTRIPTSVSELFSPEVLGIARYGVYIRAIEVIQANWLTGVGFGAFLELTESIPFDDGYRAHDIISRVWLAAGLPAVILLFINYVLTAKSYIGSIAHNEIDRSYVTAYAIGFAGLSVGGGLANNMTVDTLFYIFIFCGTVLIPMAHVSRQQQIDD